MIFISFSIEEILVPCSYCAPFFPPPNVLTIRNIINSVTGQSLVLLMLLFDLDLCGL